MADIKISQLTSAQQITGSEMIPLTSGAATVKATSALIKEYAIGDTDISNIGDGTPTGAIASLESSKVDTSDLGTAAAKDSTNAVTQNSTDLVESGAVYTGLAAKANTSDLGTAAAKDSTNAVTQNSTDLIESGAVYTGLAGKANSADLATVATSGSYNDLLNKPTLGTAAAKASTNAITQSSTDLIESGAVYTETQSIRQALTNKVDFENVGDFSSYTIENALKAVFDAITITDRTITGRFWRNSYVAFVAYKYNQGNYGSLIAKEVISDTVYVLSVNNNVATVNTIIFNTDIANNLTTINEGKVLDARQGKVLNDALTSEKNIVNSILNDIAYINQNSTTASKSYDAGEPFVLNGGLVKAKTAISNGDTLEFNSNYEVATRISRQLLTRRTFTVTTTSYGMVNLTNQSLLPNATATNAVAAFDDENHTIHLRINSSNEWIAIVKDSADNDVIANSTINMTVIYSYV